MSSILALIAFLACLVGICRIASRKPKLESLVGEDRNPVKIDLADNPTKVLSEWEAVLLSALEHIYGGSPSTTDQQMTHVFATPPALVTAAITDLVNAFRKVGTLHSQLSIMGDPGISMKELGNIVTRDPVLSARVLKTVNSPFFRTAIPVKSIHTGVNILGLTHLKNLIAFGTVPYGLFKNPGQQAMFKSIWQHMNSTAITASFMARASRDMDSGALYTAGLMHDIGKLVLILLIRNPDETEAYPQCLGREFERLAVTHLQAAQIMARSGIIPDQLHALVLDHHLPALLPVTQLECSAEHAKNLCILFLANQVAKLVSPDGTLLDDVRRLDQFDPSYREIISKAEARQILLSPGLVRDVLSNVHVVQAMLN